MKLTTMNRPTSASGLTRRAALRIAGGALAGAVFAPRFTIAADAPANPHGVVIGEVNAAKAGHKILADGGNAVDAVVSGALVATVSAPSSCGIGGYGGSAVFSMAGGRRITALDFNTTAPAAARPDMFPLDDRGVVKGRVNEHGWLASGVPGILAGLELALKRHGTKSFREVAAPAIELAENGFSLAAGLATALKNTAATLRKDAGAGRLLLKDGEAPKAGDILRNPDLGAMLKTLAQRNSVGSFYHGDIALRIAEAFQKNGGIVTAKDLAAYRAREVEPLELKWRGHSIRTAPLTAGGLTILEALAALDALDWEKLPATPSRTHARLEALRLAWRDRLELLGDAEKTRVPVARLLSRDYAFRVAGQAESAMKEARPLPIHIESKPFVGTIHLSAADKRGNLAALTLTHGNGFGACVAVDGLGLVLGHGMSRFEPQPGHPNAPAPGKRPLHNMCPGVVLRDGRPVLAFGGTGGRRIPNAIWNVLTHFAGLDATMEEAVAAPRLHTEGGLKLEFERPWPTAEQEYFKGIGFNVVNAASARVSAASFDPKSGDCRAVSR